MKKDINSNNNKYNLYDVNVCRRRILNLFIIYFYVGALFNVFVSELRAHQRSRKIAGTTRTSVFTRCGINFFQRSFLICSIISCFLF